MNPILSRFRASRGITLAGIIANESNKRAARITQAFAGVTPTSWRSDGLRAMQRESASRRLGYTKRANKY